jgi:hypothetical protein
VDQLKYGNIILPGTVISLEQNKIFFLCSFVLENSEIALLVRSVLPVKDQAQRNSMENFAVYILDNNVLYSR